MYIFPYDNSEGIKSRVAKFGIHDKPQHPNVAAIFEPRMKVFQDRSYQIGLQL